MYIFWTEQLLLKPAYLDVTQVINSIIYTEWTKPTDIQIPKKPKGKKKNVEKEQTKLKLINESFIFVHINYLIKYLLM